MTSDQHSGNSSFTELSQFSLDPKTVRLLPLAFCHKHHVVVLEKHDREYDCGATVGMAESNNQKLLETLESLLRCRVKPVQLNRYEVHQALNRGYNRKLQADSSHGHIIDLTSYDNKKASPNSTTVELLDHLLIDAIELNASDIHLESYLSDTDLRFRIDGILQHQFTRISLDKVGEVINRLKILSELDITEHQQPQDGRFRVTFIDDDLYSSIDFRLNILPGPTGEDAVIRVLDASNLMLDIDRLGLTPPMQEQLEHLIHNPEGLLLVTGPTGSGKTTTLYSLLDKLRDKGKKIVTAEDPIEYYVDKINQKQVSSQVNMAALSRAFLRHDPDIMLIGEIRDYETAEAAAKASATGHLVFSSVHTPDAIGAIQRLRGLKLEDDEISNALLGIIAQRLLRKVCPSCAEELPASKHQQQILGHLIDNRVNYQGRGCDACRGTGYRGRIGIFELLIIDESIQNLIFNGASSQAIRQQARKANFQLMLEDALNKVGQGLTSLEEIFRTIPYRQLITTVAELEQLKEMQ